MAIGTTPLIPLNRVLADPEARFLRFGVNDSQLFGKPLVSFPTQPRPPEPPTKPPRADTVPPLLNDTLDGTKELGKEAPKPLALPEFPTVYSGRNGPAVTLAPASPRPGTFLDVTA